MKWLSYGPRALWFQFAERAGETAFHRSQAIAADLDRAPPPGLIEYVPALTTVVLEFDPHVVPRPAELAPELMERFASAGAPAVSAGPVREIPVRYDGEDLGRIADAKQLSAAQIVELHTAPIYRVYMLGFAPGFPYLGDLDPRLRMPRLASPRPTVSAGAVAIGGEHTGIYTTTGPGGWNIVGHTRLKIFDRARGRPHGSDDEMFLLQRGDCVRFVAVD